MGNGGLTIAGYLPDYAAAGITDWMRAIAADFEERAFRFSSTKTSCCRAGPSC